MRRRGHVRVTNVARSRGAKLIQMAINGRRAGDVQLPDGSKGPLLRGQSGIAAVFYRAWFSKRSVRDNNERAASDILLSRDRVPMAVPPNRR